MARVTVEDCILNVSNRFELVLIAAKRAREIAAGAPLTVLRDNDKNPVIALREISENTIPIDGLRQNIIKSMRKNVFLEDYDHELDEELQSIMHEAEQPWVNNKEDSTIYSDEEREEDENDTETSDEIEIE